MNDQPALKIYGQTPPIRTCLKLAKQYNWSNCTPNLRSNSSKTQHLSNYLRSRSNQTALQICDETLPIRTSLNCLNSVSDQNALQNSRRNSSPPHHLPNYFKQHEKPNCNSNSQWNSSEFVPLYLLEQHERSIRAPHLRWHSPHLTPPKHTTSPRYPRHSYYYLVAIKVTQSFANPSQHNLLLTLHATALHAPQAPVHKSQRSRRRPQQEFRRNCFLVFFCQPS